MPRLLIARSIILGFATVAAWLTVGPIVAIVVVLVGFVLSVPAIVRHRLAHADDDPERTEELVQPSGRRRFLKLASIAAVSAPAVALPKALGAIPGFDSKPSAAGGEPALTTDGRIRQWTMIIDLRFCDGCQSVDKPPQCTLACIEGHFVPEPMEWIQVFEDELSGGGTGFVPVPCQQCQNPPCVNVCPVGATFSEPSGTVLIDQERCIGCRICMAACPYDRRFFNWGNPPIPPEALLSDYSAEHQAPATIGTVMKCDFCPDMVRAGSLPFCVQACPNSAIYYGDLEEDIATNGEVVVSASNLLSESNSYRLKENLGTEPRVHYIPGHGELVGRNIHTSGRLATKWPWIERAKRAVTWTR